MSTMNLTTRIVARLKPTNEQIVVWDVALPGSAFGSRRAAGSRGWFSIASGNDSGDGRLPVPGDGHRGSEEARDEAQALVEGRDPLPPVWR